MPSALIDLDTAPAAHDRPGRSRPRGRSLLAVLSVLLIGLAGPAAPTVSRQLRATLITARDEDNVFVSGNKLYVVDAVTSGRPRPMRTYALPDGKLLARTDLPIPEAVTGVLAAGDATLVETTVGQRPAVMALDNATGQSRWWQFGMVRGASAAAGLVLLTDDKDDAEDFDAVDLRTGAYRWEVLAPVGGLLLPAGQQALGLPQWLVSVSPEGRLDSYDARTGKRYATARAAPFGTLANALAGRRGSLFVLGATAYALPALTTRWSLPDDGKDGSLAPDCGPVICSFRPGLAALDPATGRTLWTAGRWTTGQRSGDFLVAGNATGTLEQIPLTVLDPRTGRVRARLGGWRALFDEDGTMTYAVDVGLPTLFGRFEPGSASVRVLGSTEDAFGHCDAAAGAVVCHLTDGPVAIWRL